MRGIGAFGGFVLAALVSACSGEESGTAPYVLATPTWSSAPVVELELTDPHAVHLFAPDRGSTDPELRTAITERGTRVELPMDGMGEQQLGSYSCSAPIRDASPAPDPKPTAITERRRLDAYAECTMLFDDEMKGTDIEARLSVTGGRSPMAFFIASGRPFRFHRLNQGTATLTIVLGNSNIELHRMEDIAIPETGPALDQRLSHIDLRGRLRPVRARLLQPNGSPSARVLVRAKDAGDNWANVRTDRDGWVKLALPSHVGLLEATVDGFQPVRLFDGVTIRLAAD